MPIFRGAGVAIVTPMKDNYEVDYEGLETNINYQIDHGTDAIIIAGTTGEGATLTEEEHVDVIRAAVEFTKGRIPVVAGSGSNCTRTAVWLSEQAERAGADALLVVTPYYNKATQNGLIKHFTTIAESVKCPLIIYNVPSRTGCNILPATVAELVKNVPNIAGIKDAAGNPGQSAEMMHLCDGRLELYSGEDGQVLPLLAIGGIGVISVLSNVAPQQTHDMVMEYLAGDQEKAMQIQLDAAPLVDALFCEVNPIPVKAALKMLGMPAGPLRPPLYEMEEAHQAVLRQELINFGLL